MNGPTALACLRAVCVLTLAMLGSCEEAQSPTGIREWRNAASCPADPLRVGNRRCEAGPRIQCRYGDCEGSPAMTARCDPSTHRWVLVWRQCRVPVKGLGPPR